MKLHFFSQHVFNHVFINNQYETWAFLDTQKADIQGRTKGGQPAYIPFKAQPLNN